jgi:hypothetical protein
MGLHALYDRDAKTTIGHLMRAEGYFAEAFKKTPEVVVAVRDRAEYGRGTAHSAIENERKRQASGGVLKN